MRTTLLNKEERTLLFKCFQLLKGYYYLSLMYDKEQNVLNVMFYTDDKGGCKGFSIKRENDKIDLWEYVYSEMLQQELYIEFPELKEHLKAAMQRAKEELIQIKELINNEKGHKE